MPVPPSQLLDFVGQVVVVTGGARGIGRGIASRFAEAGARVVIAFRSSRVEAEETAAAIVANGGEVGLVQGDLTIPGDALELIDTAWRRFDRLDVVINNAGSYPLHPFLELSEANWDQVIDANLKSAFLTTQAAARTWIEQRRPGAVINVSSIEAWDPAPLHAHYNAAKGGLMMLTRSTALELGPHGIRVNAVAPGLIDKPGLASDWPDGVERYLRTAPLQRLGAPQDVADACLFLASPLARWITGVSLPVDGGVMSTQSF